MQHTSQKPRIILRLLIIVLVLSGVIAQQFSPIFRMHGGYVAFFYFTTQSNVFLLFISVALLVYELKAKQKPKLLITLEHIAVSATTLTFIVFALLLGPFMETYSYYYSITNVTLHNLAPIGGIIAYLMTRDEYAPPAYYGLISGLYYLVFAYVVHALRGNFGPFEFPYFFLDYKANGWFTLAPPTFGVVYYFILIFFMLLGISVLLLKLKNNEQKSKVIKITAIALLSVAFIINLLNVLIKLNK